MPAIRLDSGTGSLNHFSPYAAAGLVITQEIEITVFGIGSQVYFAVSSYQFCLAQRVRRPSKWDWNTPCSWRSIILLVTGN